MPRSILVVDRFEANSLFTVAVFLGLRGIDPTDIDRVPKLLFTTKATDIGMDLSICRSIVEAHHGRIWVFPASGFGSVFEFALPTKVSEV